MDIAGRLIGKTRAQNINYCCAHCNQADGCEGFTFLAVERACYLKGAVERTFHKAGCISRLKAKPTLEPGLCEGFKGLEEGADAVGRLLEAWPAPYAEACCKVCKANSECQGFTFFAHHCYLKGNVTGTHVKDGCVAGLKQGRRLTAGVHPPFGEGLWV